MKFDDIVKELGDFGAYQKRIYFLVCLVAVTSAFQTLAGVFILAIPDHRCAIPGLLNDTYQSQGQWHDDLISLSIPWSEDDNAFSECDIYEKDTNSSTFLNHTTSCNRWVYSKDPFEATFVSEANLVCDDISLRTYANMVLMAGKLAGALVLAPLSDLIGRRKVLLLSVGGLFVSSISTAFVSTYVPFLALRFLTMFFNGGDFLTGFVIGVELVGPKYRKIAGIVIEIYWAFGLFIEDGLAYGLRDWRYLQIALSVPAVVLLIIFAFIVPESARWLISKGMTKQAAKILTQAAKSNGVTLSEKMLELEDLEQEGEGDSVWHMFTNPTLLVRSLIVFFNWAVASMVYFGLSLNTGNLSGDIYLNFFFSALVELVSYVLCLALLDKLGRKPLQCLSMIFGGVACICTLFPVIYGDGGLAWLTVALAMVGKLGASAAFAIIYIYSAELFPTVVRNSGMGLCSLSARIGGIVAPYIADINNVIGGDIAIALPLLIFGGTSILAGLLALLLPETALKILPETVLDAKQFGKKVVSKARVSKGCELTVLSEKREYEAVFTVENK